MGDNKKEVAAISAVVSYLKQEEEAIAFQQFNATHGGTMSATSRVSSTAWGMSGRQAQMQTRSLMLMKALYRSNG